MVESGNLLLVFFLTANVAAAEQSGGIMTGVGAGRKGGRERGRGLFVRHAIEVRNSRSRGALCGAIRKHSAVIPQ